MKVTAGSLSTTLVRKTTWIMAVWKRGKAKGAIAVSLSHTHTHANNDSNFWSTLFDCVYSSRLLSLIENVLTSLNAVIMAF